MIFDALATDPFPGAGLIAAIARIEVIFFFAVHFSPLKIFHHKLTEEPFTSRLSRSQYSINTPSIDSRILALLLSFKTELIKDKTLRLDSRPNQ
jgi:hypothetical protein